MISAFWKTDFHFAAFLGSLVLCTLGFASLCAGEFHHAFWAAMIAAMIAQMPEIDGEEDRPSETRWRDGHAA